MLKGPRPGFGRAPVISPLVIQPGLQSGVERLAEMPLSLGGTVFDPAMRYRGQDGTVLALPAYGYGPDFAITGSGADMTVDGESPLAAAADEVVTGNGGKNYSVTGAYGDPSATNKALIIEVVVSFPLVTADQFSRGTQRMLIPGEGWTIASHSNGTLYLRGGNGSSSAYLAQLSGACGVGFVHCLLATRDNGDGTSQGYAAKNAGASYYVAALAIASITPATPATAALQAFINTCDLAWLSIWSPETGALVRATLDALAAERYAALIGSKPSRTKYSILNPTAKGCTSAAHQTKLLSDGTSRLFLMGAGSPRFEKGVDGAGTPYVGAVIEGAVTNLCLQSDDLGTTWTATDATPSASAEPGPDGLAVAGDDTLTASADGGHAKQTFASITAAAHVYSHYVKRDGAADVTGKVQLVITSTGAVIATADFTAGENWSRPYVTGTATLNDTEIRIVIDNNGESIFARGAQLETGAYPSELVKTTTAAATKPADIVTFPITEGQDIGVGQGSMAIKFVMPVAKTGYFASINDGTTTNQLVIYTGGISTTAWRSKTGGLTGSTSITANVRDNVIHDVLMTWQSGRLRICLDGVWGTDDLTTDIPTGLTQLNVGSTSTPTTHAGPIRVIKVAPHKKPVTWANRWR